MALYKRTKDKKSKNAPYWYEFQYAGKRFRGSTGFASQREAEKVEDRAREKAKQDAAMARVVNSPTASLRSEDAALRYYEEAGKHLAGVRDVHRDLVRIVEYFGAAKLLCEIDDHDIKGLVEARKKQRAVPAKANKAPGAYPLVSAGTVNHLVVRAQALFTHARREWKIKFDKEPDWRSHKLHVPRKTARVLEGSERAKIDLATRADYEPFVAFASTSALRFASCVSLKWSEVHWQEGVIVKPGKRKPGGREKIETVPITSRIREILEPLRGNHSTFIFTFVAQRNHDGRKKGQRYPLTYQGAATMWKRLCEKAEVENFGFHGLRRDRATKVWRATGNVVAVNRLLNHGDIATTMKYLGVDVRDVAAAMEKADSLQEVPTTSPHKGKTEAA